MAHLALLADPESAADRRRFAEPYVSGRAENPVSREVLRLSVSLARWPDNVVEHEICSRLTVGMRVAIRKKSGCRQEK
jgi:hypothetical protein